MDTVVTYPIHALEMSKWMTHVREGQLVYDLYAVVHHMGGTDGGEWEGT